MNLSAFIKIFSSIEGQSVDETRKRTFLSFCIVICIPFVALFAINDLKNQRIWEGLSILFVLAVFISNLFALKYIKNMIMGYRFSGLLVLSLLCYELAIGGGEGYAFLWFYFFPIAAFYLVGKKEGIIWVGLSLLISAFFFLNPLSFEYSVDAILRFLITYSIVSLLSFGLEFSRSWYYQELMSEKKMLEEALSEVKTLQGLLPICSFCKRIRDDKGYWNQIEAYIDKHSEAKFSHSICPECSKEYYADFTRNKLENKKGL
jgi:hypothetical protein